MRTREELAATLYSQGTFYWDKHPFHVRLHHGGCTREEVRAWVANRWYYQNSLSQKNGAIIANCPIPSIRAMWISRIMFQEQGGLDDWLKLAKAVGLREIPPPILGVRFVVDSYVNFCKSHSWLEGAAAALTELFAPDHMAERVRVFKKHYPWIDDAGYAYFESRIPVVRKDSDYTLNLVLDHCTTKDLEDAAISALRFKCDILWAMLDAIAFSTQKLSENG
jgi:pyrroloquinoline-quinone synthase